MGGDIIILAHHLEGVIARYYFSEEWELELELIKEAHGKDGEKVVYHVKRLVNEFFNNSTDANITIVAPDSFCSPNLSSLCKSCLTSFAIDTPPPFENERDRNYREYQLKRIKTDEDYRIMRHIFSVLEDVLFLLYYDLEPGKYPSQFLIKRIGEVGKKVNEFGEKVLKYPTTCYLPSGIGYSHNPRLAQYFPNFGRFMEGGLFEDFIKRSVAENLDLNDRKITGEELNNLKSKYPALFTSVGSDKFYYEVLNVLSSEPANPS